MNCKLLLNNFASRQQMDKFVTYNSIQYAQKTKRQDYLPEVTGLREIDTEVRLLVTISEPHS